MKRKLHTPEQIVKKLREADAAIVPAVPLSKSADSCKSATPHALSVKELDSRS